MVLTAIYAWVVAPAAALMLTIAVLAARRRPTPGATALAGLAFGPAIWSLTTLVQVLAGYELSVIAAKAAYVGITLTVLSWFVLAAEYTGRERYVSRPVLAALCIEPLLVNVLVWTNENHHLIWHSTIRDAGSVYGFEVVYGIGFWGHALYSYLLLIAGTVMMLEQLYRSESLYRGQSTAMLVSVLVPWAGNALWLSGTTGLDWTPLGFGVAAGAVYWAMASYEFMDLSPVARDTVVDRIPSGVVVIDPEGRITDANDEMECLLDDGVDDLVGTPATDAFADWPRLSDELAARTDDIDGARHLERSRNGQHFDITIEPFADDRGRRAGRIVLVHDVTEQKRREQELQRQNEQLDRFASVLSHDLRNPLNVADGYLDLLEETGDPDHAEQVRSAHERMDELIEDVRTLVAHGQTISDPERLDLTTVAEDAAGNVDTRGADLQIGTLGTVSGDRNRLTQAFENLFRNAVEHGSTNPASATPHGDARAQPASAADASVAQTGDTDSPAGDADVSDDAPNTTVTIRVGTLDAGAGQDGFFVADDGPGIPADARSDVFESGHTTNDDGTGLGLAIVQNAIEAHGWAVEATESDAGGARFEVTGVSFLDS
ncbi:PAS/PAC sensor signal transduction histidine kinase [Natronoarchaeum philippinense]|uniref:histidine kinase n=1 Tax=Natronoarchaeum philippinense TaxID=558529 RepID=A0A285NDD1_NATPI|nr:histidine kinase N-terminal 7TM domain-containing protein [Natronoarchaeum philippinense]SNZ05651.1 PAS/PAC sensor signal transduction histidine kinase [Natronoarchaeum philippinense]